jgi:hypothetical protein
VCVALGRALCRRILLPRGQHHCHTPGVHLWTWEVLHRWQWELYSVCGRAVRCGGGADHLRLLGRVLGGVRVSSRVEQCSSCHVCQWSVQRRERGGVHSLQQCAWVVLSVRQHSSRRGPLSRGPGWRWGQQHVWAMCESARVAVSPVVNERDRRAV